MVAGTVLDGDHRPLAGANVGLSEVPMRFDPGKPWWPGQTTGPDGRFRFESVPAGTYEVVASPARGRIGRTERAEVQVGSPGVHEVVLTFDSRTIIRGRVKDQFGKPMAQVHILILQPIETRRALIKRDGDARNMVSGDAATDEQGNFSVGGLPAGRYVATAFVAGSSASARVEFESGQDLALVVNRPRRVHATFVLDDGTPVERFSVEGSYFSKSHGEFTAEIDKRFPQQLEVRAPELGTSVLELASISPDPMGSLDFGTVRLSPGRIIEGTVRDATSNVPVGGAVITLTERLDLNRPRFFMCNIAADEFVASYVREPTTDAQGHFSIRIGAGAHTLFIRDDRHLNAQVLVDDRTNQVSVPLEEGLSISGQVFSKNGDGEPGFEVSATGRVRHTALSGPDGRYRISGLPPGRYTVDLWPSWDRRTSKHDDVTLYSDQVVDLEKTNAIVELHPRIGESRLYVSVEHDLPLLTPVLLRGNVDLPRDEKKLEALLQSASDASWGDEGQLFAELPSGDYTLVGVSRGSRSITVTSQPVRIPGAGTYKATLKLKDPIVIQRGKEQDLDDLKP